MVQIASLIPVDMNLSKLQKMADNRGAWNAAVHWNHKKSDMDTTLLLNSSNNPVPSHPSQIPGTRLSLTLLSPLLPSENEDLFVCERWITYFFKYVNNYYHQRTY